MQTNKKTNDALDQKQEKYPHTNEKHWRRTLEMTKNSLYFAKPIMYDELAICASKNIVDKKYTHCMQNSI